MGHRMVILENSSLMEAVEDYFELSSRTQNLCASLREFVRKRRDDHQIILDRAISMKEAKISLSEEECKEILEELKVFICVEEFESVYKSLADVQSQLGIVRRYAESYKKLMKSRSVAAALVRRLKNLGLGMRNVCERNIIGVKSKVVLVEAMKLGTFKSCRDVETMRVLMDRLHVEVKRRAISIHFGERRGDSSALLLSLQHLTNTQPQFLKQLEFLERQTLVCNSGISMLRASVVDKLTVMHLIH